MSNENELQDELSQDSDTQREPNTKGEPTANIFEEANSEFVREPNTKTDREPNTE
jgi:hypothetical protein